MIKQKICIIVCVTLIFFTHTLLGLPSFTLDPIGNNSLTGLVSNAKDKTTLIGAVVHIHDLKLGTTTDDNGAYSFSDLPKGTFQVEFSFVGYKTISVPIKFDGDTKYNIELSESAIEESEVVVTGVSKATEARRSPIPILSAKHEYLDTHLETNIIDGIAKLPGVSAVTTGPNISKPFIRGLGYNRILTLYDGVRQEGQQWGDEHGIEVDQYGVDHVEVVKGPASLSYGSDALAGVVNLIPTPTAPEGQMVGNFSSEYHSNNGLIGNSLMFGGYNSGGLRVESGEKYRDSTLHSPLSTLKGFEWMIRISHKEATNYRNAIDGRVYGTAFNETDASASLGLHKKWGYSHLQLSLYNDLQEIPDGSRDEKTRKFTVQTTEIDTAPRPIVSDDALKSYTITPLHQLVQHYRAALNNNFIIGDGQLNVNLSVQRSVRREYSHPEFVDVPGLYLQLNTIGYDIKYSGEWRGEGGTLVSPLSTLYSPLEFVLGTNGFEQKNDVSGGTDFIIPSYNQFDLGFFALAKKTFDKLDIAGGIRYDTRFFSSDALYTKPNKLTGFTEYSNDTIGADKLYSAYSTNFSGASGSLGLTYNFSKELSLKFNVARGYRAPNVLEITADGVHPGTNIYQIGNPNFKPEFSIQEDLGVTYASGMISLSLSVFNNHIDNFIFNEKLSAKHGGDSVIVAGNQTFKFQQATANLYGGEFTFDIHPIPEFHFENSLSVVYGSNAGASSDSTRYLPFIPPLHGTSELRYTTAFTKSHISNAFVYTELQYYAAQNRVFSAYNTETSTPGYVLTNIGLGATFLNKKGNPALTLSLIGNNIFNVAYQDHLSRLKYFEPYPSDTRGTNGIYNMGRNVALKVNVPFR